MNENEETFHSCIYRYHLTCARTFRDIIKYNSIMIVINQVKLEINILAIFIAILVRFFKLCGIGIVKHKFTFYVLKELS